MIMIKFCSCEYVILRERGQDEGGTQLEEITWFDGHLTDETYESRTDKVLLQFCYRSETFSARNIQLIYKAIGKRVCMFIKRFCNR